MAFQFPTVVKASPSFTEPDKIIKYAQKSGAFNLLADGGRPRVKLSPEDMSVYIHTLDVRTNQVTGQSSVTELPSASVIGGYVNTGTYLLQTRFTVNYSDNARGAIWGVPAQSAANMAAYQSIFQGMRGGLLYGFTPSRGEGILNAQGVTQTNLPPDSKGNTTASTYDNGEMLNFLLAQITGVKIRTFQTGNGIRSNIKIVSPQRIFAYFAAARIVQLTSYQRPGAGTGTIATSAKLVMESNGDTLEWFFDDTLEGKGANNSDAIIITLPEIETPNDSLYNTNYFASNLQPQLNACNLMYVDFATPVHIPTPVADGGLTTVYRQRATGGWGIHPEATTVVNMAP